MSDTNICGKIEKLSARNYATWKIMMCSLLTSKGLSIVCDKKTEVTEDNVQKHEEAKFLMYSSMDAQQVMATGSCESASDLWQKIKENHEGAEQDLRNNLLAEFLGFKHKKDESIVQYCGRYEQLLGRLESTGHKIDEGTKLWVFRNTLPRDIKATVNMWTLAHSAGNAKPVNISELITQLKIQYHMDRQDKHEDSVALYSGENRSNPEKSFKKNDSKPPPIEKTCNYCKGKGHWWKDCVKKRNDDQRKKKYANKPRNDKPRYDKSRNDKPNRSGAFIVDGEREKYHSFSPGSEYWIVDSGATSHMTAHKGYIEAYEEFEEPRIIRLGDGKPTKAFGQGKVPFISNGFEGELHSVLWVPELRENLFSVSRAMAQGCDVKFTHNPTEVSFLKENSVKLKGSRTKEGLFVLHLKPQKTKKSSRVETLAAVTAEEWHQRYAHGSINSIRELAKKGAVKGLVFKENNTDKCTDCALGKICRVSHPSRNHILATDKVAVLHFDTCGPIAETSLGGHSYFVLGTEEFSDYKIISFAGSKAEIPALVKKMISQVALESKRPVKLVVTDNGTEYCNRTLSSWLDSNAILHRTTVAYTPQQNGRAERANRTIIEGVRTLLNSTKLPEQMWAEAANTVVYTNNRLLSPRNKDKTRFELYFKRVPDVSNLRVFGQRAIVRIPDRARNGKLSNKGEQCLFVGYTDRWNTYRFYSEESGSILIACDVVFLDGKQIQIDSAKATNDQQEVAVSFKPADNQEAHVSPQSPESQVVDSSNEGYITDNDSSMDTYEPAQDTSGDMQSSERSGRNDSNGQSEQASSAETEQTMQSESSTMEHLSSTRTDEDTTMENTDGSQHTTSVDISPVRRVTRATSGGVQNLTKPKDIGVWFWGNGNRSQNSSASKSKFDESALFTLDDEPLTVKDAQESRDWDKWKKAMDEELEALNKNQTWLLVDKPTSSRCIKNKWVFKVKLNPLGDVERYKARLVAKGYSQIPNVDYKETYAPVAGMNTIRLVFAIANQMKMEIVQFDIKTAFLYGDLKENIYMEYPEGYPNPENKVCKLIKSLYGLKQAPRQWNLKFDSFLQRFKLEQSIVDKCLYFNNEKTLLLAIYVDDGLVVSRDRKLLDSLIDYLKKNFELKVMDCESYLGFQVLRDKKHNWLKLQQAHYADKILEKFNMLDCKPASTPEEVGAVDLSDAPRLPPDAPFKELVGSLLYLVTCTRPDIAHAVSVASRTSEPTEAHWKALKRILRYIKGTRDVGIHFRWEKFPKLVGYSDADYANDIETRRSTTGYCIMFGGGPVAWRCQRQAIVTLSTTEAEYVSGCELVKELLPIRELLLELDQVEPEPTPVLIDNQSTVKIAKNDGGQQRTKHIDVRDKWLNEQVDRKKIEVKHITADHQVADMLTKPLHKAKFVSNRNLLLSTMALIALLTLVSGEYFPRTNPLYFRQSPMPYFSGDTRFKLTLNLINPCKTFFRDIASPDRADALVEELIKDCKQSFSKKVTSQIDSCKDKPFTNDIAETFFNTGSISARPKREPITAALIGLWALVVTGVAAGSLAVGIKNNHDMSSMKDLYGQQRQLLQEGMAVYEGLKNSVEDIHHWSKDISARVQKAQDYPGIMYKVAGFISKYEELFTEQGNILKDLNDYLKKGKVSPSLNTATNVTLWDEPAAEWSSVKLCTLVTDTNETNVSWVRLELLFNMPIRDKSIAIMEAMPIDFYNVTEHEGKKSLCWMKYKGPKLFIMNDTASCMTEAVENMIADGAVRSQVCRNSDDEFKPKVDDLFQKETCQSAPSLNKRRIQDREFHGLHRIYCYPFNITVNNHTTPCPDYPFELSGGTTYKIANFEHTAVYAEANAELKTRVIRLNDIILNQLKVDKTAIKTLNSTQLNATISSYYEKLQKLPLTADFKQIDWLDNTVGWIKKKWQEATGFLETFGIILGVIASSLLLVLLAPVLELLFVIFGVFKFIARLYASGVKATLSKLGITKLNKRDDRFKLV